MWKDFFEFTKGERQGLIILLLILLVVIALQQLLPFIETNFQMAKDDSLQIVQWQKRTKENKQKSNDERAGSYYEALYDTLELFRFDPNKITKQEWISLGLNEGQVQTIMNYRKKGGRFYEPEDVKAMYTIDDEQYSYLKPWITIENARKEQSAASSEPAEKQPVAEETAFNPDTLYDFNPNTIDSSQWVQMGVDAKTAGIIKKYIASGARFNEASDLKKIYSFPAKAYEKLKPYVVIPDKKNSKTLVELNKAGREELLDLKGIGDYYAKMIIKYRDLLGGYYHKAQLMEVYNFRESTYKDIKDHVHVEKEHLKKIPVKEAGFKELIRHPYINKLQTREILELKDEGELNSLDILTDKKIFSDTIFSKVKHYLIVKEK